MTRSSRSWGDPDTGTITYSGLKTGQWIICVEPTALERDLRGWGILRARHCNETASMEARRSGEPFVLKEVHPGQAPCCLQRDPVPAPGARDQGSVHRNPCRDLTGSHQERARL